MASVARGLALALLLVAAVGLLAAPPTPPTKEEIAKAIKQLGDDDFGVRQKASQFLRTAGAAAEPALEEAAKSNDVEVSRRSREILEDFKWGVYPDTPAKVQDLILRYRAGDDEGKLKACKDMIRAGSHGMTALVKVLAREENVQLRKDIHEELTREVSHITGDLLLDGKAATLERILELSLGSDRDWAYRNYAAFVLFRGDLSERIGVWKTKLDKGDKKAADVLYFLCRAKGDAAGARAAAQKSDDPRLLIAALTDAGDWKEAARRYEKNDDPAEPNIEKLGVLLGYYRLSGDTSSCDKTVERLRKVVAEHKDEEEIVWLGAKALYLNGRPDDGLALLKQGKSDQPVFDILAFQSRYKEAWEIVASAPKAEGGLPVPLQMSELRVRQMLGESDQVKTLLAKLTEQVEERDQYPTSRDLLRLEQRIGLTEEAFDFAGQLLAKEAQKAFREDILGAVFPENGPAASAWWTILRTQFTADETAAILKKLRRTFENKLTAKEVDEAIAQAEKHADNVQKENQPALWEAVADLAGKAGKKDLEMKYLVKAAEKATNADALVRLGDLLGEKKSWKEAAERYREAWNKDKSVPLPLLLQGRALVQAGQEAEGKKLIEVAHQLPLGNEYTRYQFAKALAERNLTEDGRRERDLTLKVGALEGWAINETLRAAGYEAQQQRDWSRAADIFEQFRLRCLRMGVSFVEYSAHVQVPALVHQNRARALVAAGKIDEAKKEWQLCLALVPGNVNIPIYLTPDLEKAGRRKEADELYNQVFQVNEQACKDYPKSANSHNTLAWLAVVCKRQLDVAEEHANLAVKLAPSNAGYLDTLAEVNFQRGRQAKAIELMKRCLELDTKFDYFRKQLKRFEAGDPKADVPDEGQ